MSDSFLIAIQRIRKDWGIPDATIMLYSKDKLLPVGYQCEPKPYQNDNLSFLSSIKSDIKINIDDNEAKP